jgi:hypothetical protein
MSVKGQSRVGLCEVIVTPDLNRPVTRVGHAKGSGRRIRIAGDLASGRENLAWYHVRPRSVPVHQER